MPAIEPVRSRTAPWWRNPKTWAVVLGVELMVIAAVFVVGGQKGRAQLARWMMASLVAASTAAAPDSAPTGRSSGGPGMLPVGGGELGRSQSRTHSFPIDVEAPCGVLILYSAGELHLDVTSPSGKVWSSRAQGSSGGSGRSEGIFGLAPGWTDGVWIDRPEPGAWTARVTADAVPDSLPQVGYVVMLMQNTGDRGPVLRSLIPDRTYHVGERLEVRASLLESGRPIEGAQVEAHVGAMPDAIVQLDLRDDGRPPDATANDGIFSANVPELRTPGFYMAAFSASRTGVTGKPDFRRTTSDEFSVSRSRSRLNGRFRDFGRDTNGDGLFDELVIEVGVTVTDRTRLGLRGMLFDPTGKLHDGGSPPLAVEPGERTLELKYPTEYLYKAGAMGPFLLDTLRLFEEEGAWIAGLDERTGVYRTKPYTRGELQHEPIVLNGEVEVRGVDPDGNGRFDALVVQVGVDIDVPGDYLWHAVLRRRGDDGGAYAQGNEQGPLDKGSNRLRFEFPGACIAKMAERDEYVLESLLVGLMSVPKPPARAPKHSFSAGRILIPDAPPPSQFETTGPERSLSSLGGTYWCSAPAR